MPVIKDLIPDLKLAYAQYTSVKPWLQSDTPAPERNACKAKLIGQNWMVYGNVFYVFAVPRVALVIGGIRKIFRAGHAFYNPTAGLPIAAMTIPANGWMI